MMVEEKELTGFRDCLSAFSMIFRPYFKYAYVVFIVSLFFIAGPGIIVLNKQIITPAPEGYGCPFPVFVSSAGLFLAAICITPLINILDFLGYRARTNISLTWRQYMMCIVPTAALGTITLALGNIAYLYLDVSLAQIIKAFNPVVVFLTGLCVREQKWTFSVLCSLCMIAVGTIIASFQAPELSLFGTCLMVGSLIAESLRLLVMQKLMNPTYLGTAVPPLELLELLIPVTFVLTISSIYVMDGPGILDLNLKPPLLQALAVAAVLGFLVIFLSMLVIQVTSALTLKVLATLRNGLLVPVSIFILDEPFSKGEMIGFIVAFIGFALYTKVTSEASAPTVKIEKRENAV